MCSPFSNSDCHPPRNLFSHSGSSTSPQAPHCLLVPLDSVPTVVSLSMASGWCLCYSPVLPTECVEVSTAASVGPWCLWRRWHHHVYAVTCCVCVTLVTKSSRMKIWLFKLFWSVITSTVRVSSLGMVEHYQGHCGRESEDL